MPSVLSQRFGTYLAGPERRQVAKDIGEAAVYVHLDVTQPAGWQAAVAAAKEHFGHLDVLVDNAGIIRMGMMVDVSLEEYLSLAPLGIRVNSIHPGAIDTDMARAGLEGVPGNPVGHLPIGRIGEPDEVARMAVFLASDDASYSTGSEFVIDGGWLVTPAMG